MFPDGYYYYLLVERKYFECSRHLGMKAKSKAQYHLNINESTNHGRHSIISDSVYPTENNNNNELMIDDIHTTNISTNNIITEYSCLLDCSNKILDISYSSNYSLLNTCTSVYILLSSYFTPSYCFFYQKITILWNVMKFHHHSLHLPTIMSQLFFFLWVYDKYC